MHNYEGIGFNNRLSETDMRALTLFFAGLRSEIELSKREREKILDDFRALILYYCERGASPAEAVGRIGKNVLGSFYREPDGSQWFPLDSAAKVYPLYMTRSKMAVYRVSAYLTEPVEARVLRVALLACIKRFPTFATSIRCGFFWHYIDAVRRRFEVQEDTGLPCEPINVSTHRSPSFKVCYKDNRISLEVFHILTDGTGAMTFLKTLVREYERLLGREVPLADDVLDVNEPPDISELTDDFNKGDDAETASGFFEPMAPQLKGKRTAEQPAGVVQFIMSSDALNMEAKKHSATVTELVLTMIFLACRDALAPRSHGEPAVQVPVNMRKFYPSRTLRNFSLYAVVRMARENITTLDEALPLVRESLRSKTDKPTLDCMLSMTGKLVKNPAIRVAPLSLKRAVFKYVYKVVGEKTITTTFSNLGVVKTDFGGCVEMLDFILGPSGTNKVTCAMVSCGGKAVLSLNKSTADTSFEDSLAEQFLALGLEPEIRKASI